MENKIEETITGFCKLMLERYPETQSIKIIVETKDKRKIKYKKFREYAN